MNQEREQEVEESWASVIEESASKRPDHGISYVILAYPSSVVVRTPMAHAPAFPSEHIQQLQWLLDYTTFTGDVGELVAGEDTRQIIPIHKENNK